MDKSEQLEVTQADRDLWKYLLDAPKSQCTMMDTCHPATAELQAIARHRQATEARMADAVELLRNWMQDGFNSEAEHRELVEQTEAIIRSQSNG
jgi:hypothetical protein